MNTARLYEIIRACSVQLRKGESMTRREQDGISVITFDVNQHVSAVDNPDVEIVDLELLAVGVDKIKAATYRDELITILRDYPAPERLACGPSYIEVGAKIGDQGAAFQLFAIGKVLGLWDVITPSTFGLHGDAARAAAGRGFIQISAGFKP